MKILITTDTFFPMINGVSTSINILYEELKNSEHEVRILTLSQTGEQKVIGDIYYLKSLGVGIYPDARIKAPFYNKLINEVIEWRPDIVHSQTEFSTMFVAKYISSKLGIPHIHTYHTMYEDYLEYLMGGKIIRKSTAAKLTKILLNSIDAIIAPTEKTKNVLLSYGVYKHIYVIPTGIDLRKFKRHVSIDEKKKIISELGINSQDKIITYVGRTAKEKNIDEIITLFKEVINKITSAKLLIVGAGPELKNLKNLVKREGLEYSVYFTDMINPKDIYKYYKISDVFVTASNSETQGLTYIEALSSGCPIVCKWDECLEGIIIQGKNGFVYKKPWEFGHYVVEILQSPRLRENMAKEAVIKANQYSSDKFKEKVLNPYIMTMNLSKYSTNIV
ncbi:glycosyltransferase family 4 protein [Clostridium peptidivorans]|uniref:glycosyltransferase family 4 protein n=1 Tax=Clostridium peptidivorans TaxID=100174 RepID=UPI000BE42898|nr:glycosyltransferase family 4 protein [Clostridium peptidivorans]